MNKKLKDTSKTWEYDDKRWFEIPENTIGNVKEVDTNFRVQVLTIQTNGNDVKLEDRKMDETQKWKKANDLEFTEYFYFTNTADDTTKNLMNCEEIGDVCTSVLDTKIAGKYKLQKLRGLSVFLRLHTLTCTNL